MNHLWPSEIGWVASYLGRTKSTVKIDGGRRQNQCLIFDALQMVQFAWYHSALSKYYGQFEGAEHAGAI